jgi:DNA repair protein RecO (recombination protein O)
MESCRAILVRKTRWSETSLIITWVTDAFGTLRTSARGALRPNSAFSGKADLFHRAEISFSVSKTTSLHSLREISLMKPFDAPSASYATIAMASYFAELSAAVSPPMQPAPDLHGLLDRALDHLEKNQPTRRVFDHFEKETARILGVLDSTGRTHPSSALAQLCGHLPACRETALGVIQRGAAGNE